jgi:succinyl-diaminopimelate desuccinylase
MTLQSADLYTSAEHWGTSVSMTKINWGTATNVIPNSVNASFDIRFTEKYSMEKIMGKIHKIIEKHHWTIVSTIEGDIVHTSVESDFIQSYINSYKAIMLCEPNIQKEHGASDGRYFSAQGMPLLLHRPTCESIHSRNEWVDIDSTVKVYEIYRHFILG